MFSASCASYLAIRVMQQLSEDEEHNWSQAANVLKRPHTKTTFYLGRIAWQKQKNFKRKL